MGKTILCEKVVGSKNVILDMSENHSCLPEYEIVSKETLLIEF